jgi:hypothetical protein
MEFLLFLLLWVSLNGGWTVTTPTTILTSVKTLMAGYTIFTKQTTCVVIKPIAVYSNIKHRHHVCD